MGGFARTLTIQSDSGVVKPFVKCHLLSRLNNEAEVLVRNSIAVVVVAVGKWAVHFRPLIHSLLGLCLQGAQFSLGLAFEC